MICRPQSTAPRYTQPAFWFALALSVLLLSPGQIAAQGSRRTLTAEADFTKESNGATTLARVHQGATVTLGTTRAGRSEVTLDGWVAANAVRADTREGFDFAVSVLAGTSLRTTAGGGSTIATLKAGALLKRVATQGDWIRVQRTGWVVSTRLAVPPSTSERPRSTPPAADSASRPPPSADTGASIGSAPPVQPVPPPASGADVTLVAGATFSALPGGGRAGIFNSPHPAAVVERRGGWSRVQVDVWVRDDALGGLSNSGVTAAELRANPEKYLGQTVEWTLQVLAVQRADELRPELPPGQPYVLARGPLPESGFVYLVIPASEVDRFRALEPLARIRVQATVRAGRSRYLPTPVLDFVRRLTS